MKPQVCIALDVPQVEEAQAIINELDCFDDVVFKIGYQLAFVGGLDLAYSSIDKGKKIFLDLKLHDIGNTVEKGVQALSQRGFSYLTVHSYPQTMQAAVQGKSGSNLKILAVSVLTSYDDQDLSAAGYQCSVGGLVSIRAKAALEAKVDGLVCSAQDIATIKPIVGDDLFFVTPGIRPSASNVDDQKRIMTPQLAILSGSSMLVVGRPVVQAQDRAKALAQILEDIKNA